MSKNSDSEKQGIRISIFGAFIFASLGILFALWTRSQAVLLDGAFNLISGVMALFALKISNLLKEPYSERFPAGFVALEPFYILVKGLILLVLTVFVVTSNVLILIRGGNELQLGIIVIYIGIAVAGNFMIYLNISRMESRSPSPVLQVEKENWMVNALISSGIGLSFIVVLLFKDGFLKPFVPYIDQVVVILVGLISLPVPIQAIRNGLGELLLIAPATDIQKRINTIIGENLDSRTFEQWQLYMLKTGRKYWLTLTAIPVAQDIPASLPDEVKLILQKKIKPALPIHHLDVIITKDKDLL